MWNVECGIKEFFEGDKHSHDLQPFQNTNPVSNDCQLLAETISQIMVSFYDGLCYFLQKCIIYILYRQIRNPKLLKHDGLLNWGEAPDLKFLGKILT
jgi:hypothetical protein